MEHFAQFYRDGGVYMHLISMSFLAALVCSVAGLRQLRRGEGERSGIETLVLARSLGGLCLALAFLGAALVMVAVLHAAHQEAAGAAGEILYRGCAMALHPVIWALLLLSPLSLVVALRRHSLVRRRMRERAAPQRAET